MMPDIEATKTMDPGFFAAIIALPTVWAIKKEPVRLISIKRLNMT